jgi:WhiB family redox-sensing transcriptional regulator
MRHLPFYSTLPLLPNAACRGYAVPEIFFPVSQEEIQTWLPIVRTTCNACVEKEPCLEYALTHQINHGIWAGKTPEERDSIIEARLRKSAAKSKGVIQSIHTTKDYSNASCSSSESQQ